MGCRMGAVAARLGPAVLTGCGLSLGPQVSGTLGQTGGLEVGGTLRGQVELPRDFSTTLGGDISVDRELGDGASGVRGRLRGIAGVSRLPDRTGSRLGYELLGRAGYLWARIGHPLLDTALLYGAEANLPIRLGVTPAPHEADGFVTFDGYLVPSLGISHVMETSDWNHYLELSGMVFFRLHVDSSTLP